MTLDEAIHRACSEVGIKPPPGRLEHRRWINTDTLGKHGKGDGRLIVDEDRVSSFNWQTGDKATVWLEDRKPIERRVALRRTAEDDKEARLRHARAADIAKQLLTVARQGTHPYLAAKGYANELALIVSTDDVRKIGGDYLVSGAGTAGAVLVPARIDHRLTSVQLIWENGSKKFLFGGEMGAASHRIAAGRDTWLCEGYATGLSLRTALKGLGRVDTVLVCFSAANIVKVAKTVRGRCYVAADHDAPPASNPDQFGGIGAGEHFARLSGRPYILPPDVKTDINDLHMRAGIFAVQRIIGELIRRAA